MSSKTAATLAGFVLLVARGVLLWVVVPLGSISWVFFGLWLNRRGVTIGQYLGWIDNNLIVLIQRGLLRPFTRDVAQPWIAAKDMPTVDHRIGKLDLY